MHSDLPKTHTPQTPTLVLAGQKETLAIHTAGGHLHLIQSTTAQTDFTAVLTTFTITMAKDVPYTVESPSLMPLRLSRNDTQTPNTLYVRGRKQDTVRSPSRWHRTLYNHPGTDGT